MCKEQVKRNNIQEPRQDQDLIRRNRSMEQLGNVADLQEQNQQAQAPIQRSRSMEQHAPEQEQEWEVLEEQALRGSKLKCRSEFTNNRTDWSRGSQDMRNVQDAVNALGTVAEERHALRNDGDIDAFLQGLEDIENKYIDAMEKCSTYIKNKDAAYFPYNKIRYAAVKNTRECLRQELDSISEIRKEIEANRNAYIGRDVSFTDLTYDFQRQREEQDPIESLTMKDYITVLSKAEEDSMLCRNGKLYRRKDKKAGRNAGSATRENYQMAKHLTDMLLSKENIASPKTRERIRKNLLYRMGANPEEETAFPVQMSVIREMLLDVDTNLSEIDHALTEQKKEGREYQTAQQIQKLLGKSLSSKADKKALQKQVEEILKACEKSGSWKVAKIPKNEMEYLLNGGIDTVREKAYAQALRIYQAKKRLAGEGDNEPAPMTDDEMKILLGLTISEIASENSVYQSLYQRKQADFAEAQILKEDQELKENLKDTRILEFGCFTASEIRLYYTHQPGKLAGFRNTDEKRKGIELLCELTEHMQALMNLEARGVQEGLNDAEIAMLESHAQTLDRMYAENKKLIVKMKLTLHPRGGIRCGIQKLQDLYNDGQTLHGSLAGKLEKLKGGLREEPKETEARAVVAEYKAARNVIETMPGKVQTVAAFFLKDKRPSELIKRPGNTLSKEFLRLHDALSGMGEEGSAEVQINGTTFRLSQRDSILTLEVGRKRVVLPYTAEYWAKEIEGDVCAHFDRYDRKMAKKLLASAAYDDQKKQTGNRIQYEKFLTSHLGISVKELALVDGGKLRYMVDLYCSTEENQAPAEKVRNYLNTVLAEEAEKVHINSEAAMESLVAMQSMEAQEKAHVQNKIKKDVDLSGDQEPWPEEQQKILNFVGELFFSSKSGSDANFAYTEERLKKIILENRDGFEKFCRLLMDPKAEAIFADKLAAMDGFDAAYGAVKDMVQAIAMRRPADPLSTLDEKETKEILGTAAEKMTQAVTAISNHMQELLKESVDDLDAEDDNSWKTLEDRTVAEILTQGMTGKEGEGAFNKKVLSGYITSAKEADKQNMIASAFKNAPNTGKNYQKGDLDRIKGRFLSGYLKGAGPLLHKMMQGLAISNMPPMMQEAVKDVRSNLARIDEEIVDAQLHRIIKDSNGSIDRIEKLKVLGTASVGQAVLIRIYEKGATHGVDKVVKILRPDAANHMERELEFMEKCAQDVDKEAYNEAHREQGLEAGEDYKGAMSRTFEGRVRNIKKEFDLRLEAENVETGKIYEDPVLHISTMKVDTNAKISANTLVLERAPGVSVDRFIAQQDEKRKEIVNKGDTDSLYTAMTEMENFKKEIKTKQKYLMDLTGKWLDEALFGSGFFHGDLHAGNIMMGEDGVTVIDYGNVHQLSNDEQAHILNLIASMQSMNTTRFTDHLRAMLTGAGAEAYDANKADVEKKIRTIVKKEDQASSVEKILAVLTELQKGGIDIPAGLYNFIQSFVRIAGTMTDYEALLDKADGDLVKLMDKRRRGELEEHPDGQPMYTISRNILERYEKDYQNPDAKTLEESVETALDGKVANMTDFIKTLRKKSNAYMDSMSEDPQLKRFMSLIANTKQIFIERMMGILPTQSQNVAMDIIEVKYDSSLTDEQIKKKMEHIYELLNHTLKTEEVYVDRHVKECKSARENLAKKEEIQNKLEQKIAAYERIPENETEEEKKERLGELEKNKKRLKDLPNNVKWWEKLMEVAEDWENQFRLLDPVRDAVKQMQEHLKDPDYNKEKALEDLKRYNESYRELYSRDLDPDQDQEEQEFLDAAAQLVCCTYRHVKEPAGEELDPPEKAMYADENTISNITLSPEDEKRRMQDEREACRRLEKAAEKVYAKTNPKSYREQMADMLTNPEKVASLEKGMKDWFTDTDGGELRTAYDALKAAHADGKLLTAESKEITDVTQAIGKIITNQAEKLDEIMKNKNLEEQKNNDEVGKMVKGLLKEHYMKILWRLDRMGVVYFKEHPMDEDTKNRLANERKERHTAYVKETFETLAASDLKEQVQNLEEAVKDYKNRSIEEKEATEKKKKEAEQKKKKAAKAINEALTKIFKTLTCDIKFKPQGTRLMKTLLENYERDPSLLSLSKFLTEADKYLRDLFRDTAFRDPQQVNGFQRPSKFENAYGDGTLSRETINVLLDMHIANREGEQAPLKERLQNGEQLQWVK